MTMTEFLSYLKSNHVEIKTYGHGFAQVRVADNLCYHFYTANNENGHVDSMTPIHSHRYVHSSYIIAGSLSEIVYNIIRTEEDTGLVMKSKQAEAYEYSPAVTVGPVRAEVKTSSSHGTGTMYRRSTADFHSVTTDFCITKVVRESDNLNANTYIVESTIVPEAQPCNDIDEAAAWNIVETCINTAISIGIEEVR